MKSKDRLLDRGAQEEQEELLQQARLRYGISTERHRHYGLHWLLQAELHHLPPPWQWLASLPYQLLLQAIVA
jgi:hypothetical protein